MKRTSASTYNMPLRPCFVANVAACPSCNHLVRRSRTHWWQWLLRDDRGKFCCHHCGTVFYRNG
ncbi:hypothetical protein [Candidatus Thiothrix anitrata]|uniref:GATA-type domain-containing protein n=1 Tax=Candidatus Thiothrix anitrata TaxID=2823902 RepID=A0ABX7X6Q5_9GAMM|nr:hypothetical protein [Candidatus Thiothrix anitrata]QTR51002.1 hypothetical protein J8380_05410 [Candidatus Thiothrix anitrata]